MKDELVNAEYTAMRSAQSVRQLKWMAAYNKNPELASIILDIFEMPEEDAKFMIRMINDMRVNIILHREDRRPKKKPKPVNKTVAIV